MYMYIPVHVHVLESIVCSLLPLLRHIALDKEHLCKREQQLEVHVHVLVQVQVCRSYMYVLVVLVALHIKLAGGVSLPIIFTYNHYIIHVCIRVHTYACIRD